MSEQIVQVADAASPTKNMRTIQQTAGGNTVQSEVVILATGAAGGGDTYDARQIRTLTSSDIVAAIIKGSSTTVQQDSSNNLMASLWQPGTPNVGPVAIAGALPPTSALGLVTRLPSGQTVGISGTPTVSLAAGSKTQIIDGNQISLGNFSALNSLPLSAAIALPTNSQLIGVDSVSGLLAFVSAVSFGFNEGVLVAPMGSQNALLQQKASTNELLVSPGTGTWPVSQNLLGANDNPDVSVNQKNALSVTNKSENFNVQGQLLVSQSTGGWGGSWSPSITGQPYGGGW